MAQNENISLSLANKVDILNKSQSVDARYGVYETEEDALEAMDLYGLDGRQVAVYSDKDNGKVNLYLYNKVKHQLEPISGEYISELTGDVTASGSGSVVATITDEAVTQYKLASSSVTQGKIASHAVVQGKIATGAVTTAKIQDLSITPDKLASASVTNEKLADNSINANKIQSNAVTSDKLASGAVTNIKIANNAISYEKIANNAIYRNVLRNRGVEERTLTFQAVSYSWDLEKINSPINNLNAIAYGDGMFVGVSGYASAERVIFSADGRNWQKVTDVDNTKQWKHATFGAGVFVIAGGAWTSGAAYSYDGLHWVNIASLPNDTFWSVVKYIDGYFIISSIEHNKTFRSLDGINWVESSSYTSGISDVVSKDGILYGISSGYGVYKSEDFGDSWEEFSPLLGLTRITYGNGLFIASSFTGAYKMTADFIDWQDVPMAGYTSPLHHSPIKFVNGYFLVSGGAVGTNHSNFNSFKYSYDGLNWYYDANFDVQYNNVYSWDFISAEVGGKSVIMGSTDSGICILHGLKLNAPIKSSDLENDGDGESPFITEAEADLKYVESSELSEVAFSNSYNDLDDLPTIPTKTSDLTNDGDGESPFVTYNNMPTPKFDDVLGAGDVTDKEAKFQSEASTKYSHISNERVISGDVEKGSYTKIDYFGIEHVPHVGRGRHKVIFDDDVNDGEFEHAFQAKSGTVAHLSDIDGAINVKMFTIELTHEQVLELNTTPYNITSTDLGLQAGEKVKWLLDRCEWKVDSNGVIYDGLIRLYSLSSPICTISIKTDGHHAGMEIISDDNGYPVSDTHHLSAWGTITGGTSGATVKIRLYYTTTTW